MANKLSIFNEALAEIHADYIEDVDDAGPGARYCRLHFDNLMTELLEWCDWGFAVRRAALATVPNDRPAEWVYAYAAPSNMARARYLRDPNDLEYDELPAYGPSASPWQDTTPSPFLHESGTIYSNIENAVLSYSRNDVDVSELPPLARRALALALASRIAAPVRKDVKLSGQMIQMAEVARERAIADELSRAPNLTPRWVSDAEFARAGMI